MKKRTANLIMVLIIAAIVVAGVTAAFALRVDNGDGLGSQYRIAQIQLRRCQMLLKYRGLLEWLPPVGRSGYARIPVPPPSAAFSDQ